MNWPSDEWEDLPSIKFPAVIESMKVSDDGDSLAISTQAGEFVIGGDEPYPQEMGNLKENS